jgi:hypothetical protein
MQKFSIFLSIIIVGLIVFGGTDIYSSIANAKKMNPAYEQSLLLEDDAKKDTTTSIDNQIVLIEKQLALKTLETENFLRVQEMESKKINDFVKIGISLLFLLVSLFIILSKKYDEDTKKWAFSMLTMIGGVWIGTIV